MTAVDAVVLAGGRGVRMGRDKVLLRVEGQRLVDRVVDRLAPLRGAVVVAAGGRPLVVPGAHVVPDPPGRRGPLAGLVAGLAHTSSDVVALVAGDLPNPSPEVLVRLAEQVLADGLDAAVPVDDGTPQVLHAAYHRRVLPAAEAALDTHSSLRRLLDDLDVARVPRGQWAVHDPGGGLARDWDRPQDLPDHVRRHTGL